MNITSCRSVFSLARIGRMSVMNGREPESGREIEKRVPKNDKVKSMSCVCVCCCAWNIVLGKWKWLEKIRVSRCV